MIERREDHATAAEPHQARRRALMRAHPEIRSLVGPERATAGWIAAMVAVQMGLAAAASWAPLWGAVAMAYFVGAFAALALWTLVHECSHDLVLGSVAANRRLGLVASLPLALPLSAPFRTYHLLHHRHPGHAVFDIDVPSEWEIRLVRGCPARKALWLAANPLLQSLRTARIPGVRLVDRAFLVNLALQAAFNAAVVASLGWQALGYLLLSNCFALGLHPLGARIIQEHCTEAGGQETGSYYGPANRLVFNAGYHNEHHDIARVPWNRLPKLRAAAPEFYASLESHRSWTALLLRFLADKRVRIEGRNIRGGAVG